MDSETLAKLRGLIRELSYREGDFTLVSGRKSKYYIDLKASSLHPRGADWMGELIIQKAIDEELEIDAVGGMTLGADPLLTATSLAAFRMGRTWPALIVRKEPKAHGTNQYLEGMSNVSPGAKILVLEDTTTTGGTSLKAAERFREAGYDPVAVLTVVDREEGAAKTYAAAKLRFFSLLTLNEIRNSG